MSGGQCMTGIQKIEHAHLYVEDLDMALKFYREVMGLVEIDRDDGLVYLGCGTDEFFDLAVEEGGTGVEHFAVRVDGERNVDRAESVLADAGVETRRTDGDESGQRHGVRFDIPSGTTAELVVTEKVDRGGYQHVTDTPYTPPSSTPVDLDHITLASTNVEKDATFLRDTLDWHLSDVFVDEDEEWTMAFVRRGDYHHDVGLITCDEPDWTLNHLGWEFSSIDHMKLFADQLARNDHYLEMGMNRHYAGDNIFAYFREPGGNRFEMTAEMATLDPSTPTEFHHAEKGTGDIIAAWRGITSPPSLDEGS